MRISRAFNAPWYVVEVEGTWCERLVASWVETREVEVVVFCCVSEGVNSGRGEVVLWRGLTV